MESNSKSGLKIRQIISIVLVLVILGSNLQLFAFTKDEIKEENENNSIKEELQIADKYDRTKNVTSRSSVDRTKKEENENNETNYIQIDEITISKGMDLTKRTGISKEDFKELMKNLKVDTSGFFYENSETIYDLCEKYELNEIFFCGLIGTYNLIIEEHIIILV